MKDGAVTVLQYNLEVLSIFRKIFFLFAFVTFTFPVFKLTSYLLHIHIDNVHSLTFKALAQLNSV